MECFDHTWISSPKLDTVTVRPVNGVLSVTYVFDEEQEWTLSVTTQADREAKKRPLEFNIYSLMDDLYGRNPYRGDLHAHSTGSDGKEDPVIVAANYRKEGFDFFALTDHGKWEPSDEMLKAYADIPLGIKLFHGEEVHVPNIWIHVVNFGSNTSVNTLYRENAEEIDAAMREKALTLKTPKGVDPLEYAYRKWITEEIRRAGGMAIVPHPYWIHRQSYNMSDRALEYVFETGAYDAFELVGGQSVHENNVQIAFYQEQRAKGRQIPIVGSSDSHGTDPASYFGVGRSVVFAKDMELESICDAVKSFYSVAIEQQPCGEEERVYGSYRLVKYTRFLMDHYFPSHDELCVEEGVLMREYALGDELAGDALRKMACRTEKLMKKLLRGEKS
ncbi:MAG: PHP domain-containing protein [Clostridia bacterium]|nr:PHP domain-containing protein [Clostridia bacterium]